MVFSRPPKLVLASGSRYRAALLDQIGLQYLVCAPDIDESARPAEMPLQLAERLACQKAQALQSRYPDHLVIGADQVATLDGNRAFSKPRDHADATAQLQAASGNTVVFHSAVCLLNTRSAMQRCAVVSTEVRYRRLGGETIERYLQIDRPYDCAGSARIEALGIALVESVRSDDPSALLGLPLIALIDLLAAEGVRAL